MRVRTAAAVRRMPIRTIAHTRRAASSFPTGGDHGGTLLVSEVFGDVGSLEGSEASEDVVLSVPFVPDDEMVSALVVG